MATEVYGYSDDLIEFEGDVSGEVASARDDDPTLIVCSDGTILEARYGKAGLGVWQLTVVRRGELFDRVELGYDEEAARHSDTAHFRDGLTGAWVAREFYPVE